MLSENDARRFWSKVSIAGGDDCWNWQDHCNKCGYGTIVIQRGSKLAHRIAWELTHGPIPTGLCVCHSCDNPACCNPAHLWIGTHADNMQDMVRKGRSMNGPHGESVHTAKLTEAQVILIRDLYASRHYTQDGLAALFNVTQGNIKCIVNGGTWKHLLGCEAPR